MTSLQTASLDEIRIAAARICRDYLTGRWKVVTPEQLIVKRISGGLSNFLYYVSLPDDDETEAASTEIVTTTTATTTTTMIPATEESVSNDDVIGAVATYDKNSNAKHATKKQVNQQQQNEELIKFENNCLTFCEGDIVASIGIGGKAQKRTRTDSDSMDSIAAKRIQAVKKEPREVLLRIYGQTHGGDALESMITESVVFALLSERNFGPKLHGIFPGGRIEQYIQARPLATLELSEHRISMKIAEKMGEIHSLNIPMSKEPDWLWNCMNRWLQSLETIITATVESKPNPEVIAKQKALMSSIDYIEEIKWLKSLIDDGNYKVLFCHNDLQEGNILFRKSNESSSGSIRRLRYNSESLDGNGNLDDESNEKKSALLDLDTTDDSAIDASFVGDIDPDLIIIDFEYCAYNYRGFDLANHFLEWTFDYTNTVFPFFHHRKHQYPTAVQRRDFIVHYLKKLHENYADLEDYEPSDAEINEVIEEVRIFTMFSHLFWSLWSVVNVTSNIEFGYWDYAVVRILEYQKLKAETIARRQQ